MSGLKRWARWFLFVAPARMYVRGSESGGRVSWIYIIIMIGMAALGALLGVIAGWFTGSSPAQPAGAGAIAGLLAVLAWFVYGAAVLCVMWLVRRPFELVAGQEWMQKPRRWWDT